MQSLPRRTFLKTTATAIAGASLNSLAAPKEAPLIAYIGTYSSPRHDVVPTQVDLPQGNGRGTHSFKVNRRTGVLTPFDIYELGTSPSCLALDKSQTHL